MRMLIPVVELVRDQGGPGMIGLYEYSRDYDDLGAGCVRFKHWSLLPATLNEDGAAKFDDDGRSGDKPQTTTERGRGAN